jgi:hypothetical protein
MPSTSSPPAGTATKKQPWKAVWPQQNRRADSDKPYYYAFKKGEHMKVGATAGQFMTVGQWPVEHDTGNENDTADEKGAA